MPALPDLHLTHGQVAWALSGGQPPTNQTLDQLRYLRQLGVPFTKEELGGGRGNRINYTFDHLIECGVALAGLRRGLRFREVAKILIEHREQLRATCRRAFEEQPPLALNAEWVKSRGRIRSLLENEIFIRLHDRFSETPGEYEIVYPQEPGAESMIGDIVERYPGGEIRPMLPLTHLVLELVAWALEAPVAKTGPK
jgi:hypothetical protein